jgi:hypothetical protein
MNDLFGETPRKLIRNISAYAATPGSGPKDKECRECTFCHRKQIGERAVHKCVVGADINSHTTDINSRSAACIHFSERGEE